MASEGRITTSKNEISSHKMLNGSVDGLLVVDACIVSLLRSFMITHRRTSNFNSIPHVMSVQSLTKTKLNQMELSAWFSNIEIELNTFKCHEIFRSFFRFVSFSFMLYCATICTFKLIVLYIDRSLIFNESTRGLCVWVCLCILYSIRGVVRCCNPNDLYIHYLHSFSRFRRIGFVSHSHFYLIRNKFIFLFTQKVDCIERDHWMGK